MPCIYVSAAQLTSANNSSRNLFLPIGPGEIPERGDKEVIREPAMLKYLPVHLKLRPTFNVFGTLPVMSFPSDSLPAPWDFLALVRIFLCLLLLQGHSSHPASTGRLLVEATGGGAWLSLSIRHGAVSCTSASLRDPLDPFRQGFIQHSSLSSPPVAVSSKEACALTYTLFQAPPQHQA